MRTDGLCRFQYDHLTPGQRSRARDGEPDHAGTDNHTIDLLHNCVPTSIYVSPNHKRSFVLTVSSLPWDPLFVAHSPLFEPLRTMASRLSPSTWPSRGELTRLAGTCEQPVVNASGQAIHFCAPTSSDRSAAEYERRIAAEGAVEHRDASWHDLFNALVWMTFPRTKAALNRRHAMELTSETEGRRSPARDMLTQLDEDGLVVVSEREDLLGLLHNFHWRELFWNRRSDVQSTMRWFVLGHAQYEKALQPFVGMTAKAVTICVEPGFCARSYTEQLERVDRLAAQLISQPEFLNAPKALAPVPVLGVPGWSAQSAHESFYEDHSYFRSGRRCTIA
jgi:Protein of unknown function (DUF3025)